jgi:predicted ATPase
MFLRFSFSNHRSFRETAVLPLVATRLHGEGALRIPAPGAKHGVVPVMALYGPNASGKTSVVRAWEAFVQHVAHSGELKEGKDIPFQPFRLDPEGASLPSRYELDFVVDGIRYHYGFVHTQRSFEEEWLYAWPKGHEQLWFHRQGGSPEDWYFGGGLKGRVKTLASFTGENQLFLSTSANNKHPVLEPIQRWLSTAISFSNLDIVHQNLWRSNSPLFEPRRLAQVLRLLKLADLGIGDARVESREEALQRILQRMDEAGAAEDIARRLREDGPPQELVLQHLGSEGGAWLPTYLESSGTVTLINHLHDLLGVLDRGGLYIADELDRSLHPELTAALIGLFKSPEVNRNGAQLLFTSHDVSLLERLERDEVCWVTKDGRGASQITPLSDFRVAKRDDVERDYRIGRYGALPRIAPFGMAWGGEDGKGA